MGRRISRLALKILKGSQSVALLSVGQFLWSSSVCGVMPVLDVDSLRCMGEVLANGAQQLSKLQDMTSQLNSLNQVLGNHLPSSAARALGRIEGGSGELAGLFSGISNPQADNLAELNSFSSRHGAPDFSKFLIAKDFIKKNLFAETPREESAPLSLESCDQIREERAHVVKESSINGIALASQQRNAIKKTHEQAVRLEEQARDSPTIHDDLKITNQFLFLILTELIQHRALLAQQLELASAVIAEQRPLVFKSPSLARQPGAQAQSPQRPGSQESRSPLHNLRQ